MKIKTTKTGRRSNGAVVFTAVITLTADEVQRLRDSDLANELRPGANLLERAIDNAIEFQLTEDIEGDCVGRGFGVR